MSTLPQNPSSAVKRRNPQWYANVAGYSPAQQQAFSVTREMDLHKQIMAYCDSQWPKWKYIRARSDMKSTIAVGCQDLTCFLPGGRVVCIEAKTKTGKLTAEQQAWAKEMAMLGHTVHTVRSWADFMEAIK